MMMMGMICYTRAIPIFSDWGGSTHPQLHAISTAHAPLATHNAVWQGLPHYTIPVPLHPAGHVDYPCTIWTTLAPTIPCKDPCSMSSGILGPFEWPCHGLPQSLRLYCTILNLRAVARNRNWRRKWELGDSRSCNSWSSGGNGALTCGPLANPQGLGDATPRPPVG